MATPATLLDKIWHGHTLPGEATAGLPDALAIDLHLIHEVTSPQAFAQLAERDLPVARPRQTVATMDHSTPTNPQLDAGRFALLDPQAHRQLETLRENCRRHRIPLFDLDDPRQGIVHVIGPELGLTQPGMTVVCGDSHTSTHGAFGALAFGIGTSQVAQVLATQTLLMHRPKAFELRLEGRLADGVTAKDLILAVLARIGFAGGTGHVFEYRGRAIRHLSMEGRMTVCNMSIEGGARAGLIAPDETTFDYLAGRPGTPRDGRWREAVARWCELRSDPGARFDRRLELDAGSVAPMVTFGTHPGTAVAIDGQIPAADSVAPAERPAFDRALRYMGFEAGQPVAGQPIDTVFLGSCTNGRLPDLRAAAALLRGRRLAPGVRMLVVPGSQQVQRAAEEEGLDDVFRRAGAEWRRPGCSMCLAMNGDRVAPGELAVSTSNRNFEGRQGPASRTVLASPLTAAAAALRGVLCDPREVLHA
ncbi:MAG: 3-isopropylmalate dehydratase large subunit [Acidobacteriota bacterium]